MSDISYFSPESQIHRGGLTAWGVVMIVAGALVGLIAIGSVVAGIAAMSRLPAGGPARPAHLEASMLAGLAMYLVMAIALIWTGIGACVGRRWVRPIVLIGSTCAACMGVITLSSTALTIPLMAAKVPAAQRTGLMIGMAIAAGFELCFLIAAPVAAFIFFYRSSVKRTLQLLDHAPRRWTDQIPVPLLGWAIGCVCFGFACTIALINPHVAFYTVVLNGVPAIIAFTLTSLLMIVGGWQCYRRQMMGWWLTFIVCVYWASSAGTFSIVGDPMALQRATMGNANVQNLSPAFYRWTLIGSTIFYVCVLGYSLFVRRYFGAVDQPMPAASNDFPQNAAASTAELPKETIQ